ncbi:hypothetical protein MAPG_10787 [Magnaporthiopsis poae ATCC 64411]|uniref:Uncharacterized protein n=1 Tax=Magnaporthiopsis poae (strain ATCC 64411 / 73-15) TaxID=644358 RepID=A0A0C4EDI7_MAGP6|nr:hypothetical protein MAPG_10787 [Magnaporthiopsis poae ATCC 64411]
MAPKTGRNVCVTAADGQTGSLIAELILTNEDFASKVDSVPWFRARERPVPGKQVQTSIRYSVAVALPLLIGLLLRLLLWGTCSSASDGASNLCFWAWEMTREGASLGSFGVEYPSSLSVAVSVTAADGGMESVDVDVADGVLYYTGKRGEVPTGITLRPPGHPPARSRLAPDLHTPQSCRRTSEGPRPTGRAGLLSVDSSRVWGLIQGFTPQTEDGVVPDGFEAPDLALLSMLEADIPTRAEGVHHVVPGNHGRPPLADGAAARQGGPRQRTRAKPSPRSFRFSKHENETVRLVGETAQQDDELQLVATTLVQRERFDLGYNNNSGSSGPDRPRRAPKLWASKHSAPPRRSRSPRASRFLAGQALQGLATCCAMLLKYWAEREGDIEELSNRFQLWEHAVEPEGLYEALDYAPPYRSAKQQQDLGRAYLRGASEKRISSPADSELRVLVGPMRKFGSHGTGRRTPTSFCAGFRSRGYRSPPAPIASVLTLAVQRPLELLIDSLANGACRRS